VAVPFSSSASPPLILRKAVMGAPRPWANPSLLYHRDQREAQSRVRLRTEKPKTS